MIEVDSSIIDPNELEKKIEVLLNEKKIPKSAMYVEKMEAIKLQLFDIYDILGLSKSQSQLEIPTLSSSSGFWGKIKIFLKRVVRRSLKWLWHPFVTQQNTINQSIFRTIEKTVELQTTMIDNMPEFFDDFSEKKV